jgi:ABC-type glycerol-3-phosphate transport system substrate-binding protein
MLTRRDIVRQAGTSAVILATTSPWWLVRRAHAARDKKLVVWNPTTLAPQVEKIMEEQCRAYAKQAGIKDSELDYSVIGSGQVLSKLVATLEAGNPPDIVRLDAWLSSLYRAQGHLLEVTDVVEKMQRVPGGLFPIFSEVMHQGKA